MRLAAKAQQVSAGKVRRPEWKPNWLAVLATVLIWAGLGIYSYPGVAAWFSQYNQSKVVSTYDDAIDTADPSRDQQLENARMYNNALLAGAVLEAGVNVPTGQGSVAAGVVPYWQQLRAAPDGLMGRLKIGSINLDLPFYHGTDDATLLRGLGHLEGTHLPIGGEGTRSVITGHRGLSSATMFTNLDKVQEGDTFVIEVFGEVLTYRVFEKRVVEPHETEALRPEPGRDLLTLVTCTPLGINTHRILVTAERVLPTPAGDLQQAGRDPDVPGFPWWVVTLSGAVALGAIYVWRSGYGSKRQ